MPSMQIKHVPEETLAVWRRRAGASHRSLQEYMLAKLIDEANQPTVDEVFANIAEQSGGSVSFAEATRAVREDRDHR